MIVGNRDQHACTMNEKTYALFSKLYKNLVIDETKDPMSKYSISQMNNAKKLRLLLECVAEITDIGELKNEQQ